ncbi:MAG: LacI family transcriptional regulator [Opitutaceae bacterium]|nr:LacI family transcriptional regulator [Opitutaceae bacterium]
MPPLLIADIARKAKVSPATVSRVINQPHLVAPDRLERENRCLVRRRKEKF